ncbi:GNAT family N-acetyltransferase [Sphingomicrobium aestuariivivum]|uniref:GNAT family N-acetyltransferase n=1 Tax=Sphingomicrobium aestuariivivum TaxID=1582356 RepID=UPI001FD6B0F0|nr:GNAT family N-acetyltransferase [Sphingomicrobium aestuariivivum]MCJ8191692.1 GNAT family N-acetyltransferase [Sphingomicrobium aestuariivivum]
MATTPRLRAITIERGSYDDLDAVMAVMDRAFDARYGEAWNRSQCGGILPMRGVELYLVRPSEDEPVAGFALWRTLLDESELLLLGVDPRHQGQGLGKSLLDCFIDHAKKAGATRLHLEVRDGNPAIRFYEQSGFGLAGRRREYYRGTDGTRRDALTYVKMI